jgi:hypothetical protein
MKPIMVLLILIVLPVSAAAKKPTPTCNVKFAIVYIDYLDNTYHRLEEKTRKDVENKLSKFGDVCYVPEEENAEYIFFIHTKPATYHGVRTTETTSTNTNSNPVNGTITDQSGNTANINGTIDTTTTTTSSSSVPYQVDYNVFILNILKPRKDASGQTAYTTIHTFDQKGLYKTMYGVGYGKGKHPLANVIDAATKWLRENQYGRNPTS